MAALFAVEVDPELAPTVLVELPALVRAPPVAWAALLAVELDPEVDVVFTGVEVVMVGDTVPVAAEVLAEPELAPEVLVGEVVIVGETMGLAVAAEAEPDTAPELEFDASCAQLGEPSAMALAPARAVIRRSRVCISPSRGRRGGGAAPPRLAQAQPGSVRRQWLVVAVPVPYWKPPNRLPAELPFPGALLVAPVWVV